MIEPINLPTNLTQEESDKNSPRMDLVNHLVNKVAAVINEKPTRTVEMAILSLMILQMMQECGMTDHIDFPSSMTIQTPKGWEISFQIRKSARRQ